MKLRARGPRKSYVEQLAISDDEPEAGPSVAVLDERGSSGSEYDEQSPPAEAEPDEESEEQLDGDDEDDESLPAADTDAMQVDRPARSTSRRRRRAAPAQPKGRQQAALPAAVSLSRLRGPKPAGDTLASRQRFRPWSTFKRPGQTLRLLSEPKPLELPDTEACNPCTINDVVTRRLTRILATNVGTGPLWELMEDCAWWKESIEPPDSVWTQRFLRPTMYKAVTVPSSSWTALSNDESRPYLPHADEDPATDPTPVSCLFGPFDDQKLAELPMLTTLDMSDFIPGNRALVFNAGAAVLGLDWCPISEEAFEIEPIRYLAVSPLPTQEYKLAIGIKRPSPSCIQIWSLRTPQEDSPGDRDNPLNLRCSLILCTEYGPAIQLKWCPLPCNDDEAVSSEKPRKLGILAGTFADGSLSIFAVPDPRKLASSASPLAVRAHRPIARLQLDEASCWCFDWANSDTIAVGCSNGAILVTKLSAALKRRRGDETAVLTPTHYISLHQSAVRCICWIRLPRSPDASHVVLDPTVIFSGGFDGKTLIVDTRDQRPTLLNRSRDVIMDVCFSTIIGVPLTLDFGNSVKLYSILPTFLGQGQGLLECDGPVWSLATSDFHPCLAIGGADGSCVTTNVARASKRGSLAPFFHHKIYQLDYSRQTCIFRMLENFLPRERLIRPGNRANLGDDDADAAAAKAQSKKKAAVPETEPQDPGYRASGSWPRNVCVTRVAWDSGGGLSSAPLLASATGSGLCRIDWLLGRFFVERHDVDSIAKVREGAGANEEDEDDVDA